MMKRMVREKGVGTYVGGQEVGRGLNRHGALTKKDCRASHTPVLTPATTDKR